MADEIDQPGRIDVSLPLIPLARLTRWLGMFSFLDLFYQSVAHYKSCLPRTGSPSVQGGCLKSHCLSVKSGAETRICDRYVLYLAAVAVDAICCRQGRGGIATDLGDSKSIL